MKRTSITISRNRHAHCALVWALLLLATACGSDDSNGSGDDGSGNSGSGDNGGSGAGSDDDDKFACINDVQGAPSPACEDCVCGRCPDIAVDCDLECWDLFRCLHANCDANEANLDSCAAGECSEHAAGLAQAKAIAACAYRSADRGQERANRTSCLISCNFGPIPEG